MTTSILSPAIPIPKRDSHYQISHSSSNGFNRKYSKQQTTRSTSNNSLSSSTTIHSTTPSLQSILEQKKISNVTTSIFSPSFKSSISSNFTDEAIDSPYSLPSFGSVSTTLTNNEFDNDNDALSHPLEMMNDEFMDEIDEDFFNFSFNSKNNHSNVLELVKPLNSSKSMEANNNKSSFVSNLSKSIKSFTNSTTQQNNEILFGIQPRLTDDKLPTNLINHFHSQDTELETFKVTTREVAISQNSQLSSTSSYSPSTISVVRNREPRINSQFLRLYAYEANSRQKGLLPDISPEEEARMLSAQQFQPNVQFKNDKGFALLVRQRLWQCVVLPPREDSSTSSTPEYVQCTQDSDSDEESDDSSLSDADTIQSKSTISSSVDKKEDPSSIRKLGDVKPWITLEDETNGSLTSSTFSSNLVLNPRGTLPNNTQFTVKGWCNRRWVPKKIHHHH